MPCFFSTKGDGLEQRAARFLPLEFDDVESTGNKLDAVPRRLGIDADGGSWEFWSVSFERFPLVVAAIGRCVDENDFEGISLADNVPRKRPIAWTNAAHAGAKQAKQTNDTISTLRQKEKQNKKIDHRLTKLVRIQTLPMLDV